MKTAKNINVKTVKAEAKAEPKAPAKAAAPSPAKALSAAPAPAGKPGVKMATAKSPAAERPQATVMTNYEAIARREITTDLIAQRAYIIWEQQGRPHGHDLANWLLAENQLKQEVQSFTA